MAHMIPSDGGYFDPRSKEEEMFNALKTLPDDYYVFHSYRLVRLIPGKGLDENEIDFLIFNPKYGCLFLEEVPIISSMPGTAIPVAIVVSPLFIVFPPSTAISL